MDSGQKRTPRSYTLAFKLAVVDEVETGGLSYIEAQDRHGILGKSTVLSWLRQHGRLDWSPGAYIGSPRMKLMPEQNRPLTAEERIKELEEQLEYSNQKAQFFEAVVNVLKNDYGLSVAKKHSGKSSRKGKSRT